MPYLIQPGPFSLFVEPSVDTVVVRVLFFPSYGEIITSTYMQECYAMQFFVQSWVQIGFGMCHFQSKILIISSSYSSLERVGNWIFPSDKERYIKIHFPLRYNKSQNRRKVGLLLAYLNLSLSLIYTLLHNHMISIEYSR